MIDLYYAPGPNPRKISIMLEETDLPYRPVPMNMSKGEQFNPDFLRISPNNRVPAITDSQGPDGQPIAIFESGAILLYLAAKTGRFGGFSEREKVAIHQWLFWQVGGLGPMGGQLSHFVNHAGKGNDYALARYQREYDRLLGVMEIQLAEGEYLAGEYSIADMACFPWLLPYRVFGVELNKFPRVRRWFDNIKARPAVRRAVALGMDWNMEPEEMSEEESAETVAAARARPKS